MALELVELAALGLVLVGGRRSAARARPAPGVVVREAGGATWAEGPATSLGLVLGGEPADAMAARGGVAVCCGVMFDGRGPRFLLRDRRSHVDVASREPTEGATVAVCSGSVSVASGDQVAAGCDVAVQGYPELVSRSTAVTVADSERARRVALAVMRGGRVALVAIASATVRELGGVLVRGGALAAVYCDGGRAAHLEALGRAVLTYDPTERPAAWLVLGATR